MTKEFKLNLTNDEARTLRAALIERQIDIENNIKNLEEAENQKLVEASITHSKKEYKNISNILREMNKWWMR